MLCEYGCGQEAKTILKNGKSCCKDSHNKCLAIREKNSKSQKENYRFIDPKVNPANFKILCPFCSQKISRANIKKHINSCYLNPNNLKICPICNGPIKDYKNNTTCSSKCGKHFYLKKYLEYGKKGTDLFLSSIKDEDRHYRSLCFKYHEKKCIICGEELIVAVHHYDENKDNNDPRNFIPICPTHHTYLHSNYSRLISKDVRIYHENFCKKFKEN